MLIPIIDDDIETAGIVAEIINKATPGLNARPMSSFDHFWELPEKDRDNIGCIVIDYYHDRSAKKAELFLGRLRLDHPRIRVIVYSAAAEASDLLDAAGLGIYRFIDKRNLGEIPSVVAAALSSNPSEAPLLPMADPMLLAAEEVRQDYRKIVKSVAYFSTNGSSFNDLPSSILSLLASKVGAVAGLWLLCDSTLTQTRNSGSLAGAGRGLASLGPPSTFLGTDLTSALRQQDSQQEEASILPLIDLESKSDLERGVFGGGRVSHGTAIEATSLVALAYRMKTDVLVFALEVPSSTAQAAPSALRAFGQAIENMVEIIPVVFTGSERGWLGLVSSKLEQWAGVWLVLGQGFLYLLAIALFLCSGIAIIVSAINLIASALGVSDVLAKGIHFDFTHYGVGLVNSLEYCILSITLYLLGVGVSSITNHPRLLRVPGALRYLENPDEMKRTLALAVCILLAVSGLKAVLELRPDADVREITAFVARLVMLILLLVGTVLVINSVVDSRNGAKHE
jgi:hypothetical protein